MRVIHDLSEAKGDQPCALTLGTFDGVHLGHQEILRRLRTSAAENNLQSVVITFDPHPQLVLRPERVPELQLLTTTDEKLEWMAEAGVDLCYVMKFSRDVASMTGPEFVKRILVDGLRMERCLLGHDHAFGKNRSANFETLQTLGQSLGFSVEKIMPVRPGQVTVSSTLIRSHLRRGEVKQANELLGRPYRIKGRVVEGSKRGRVVGFPTANIQVPENKLIPANGVYAGQATIHNQAMNVMVNIGIRPTFNNEATSTVEAHLLNWTGNLYGDDLEVGFLARIRDERKFESIDELKAAIERDTKFAINNVFTIT